MRGLRVRLNALSSAGVAAYAAHVWQVAPLISVRTHDVGYCAEFFPGVVGSYDSSVFVCARGMATPGHKSCAGVFEIKKCCQRLHAADTTTQRLRRVLVPVFGFRSKPSVDTWNHPVTRHHQVTHRRTCPTIRAPAYLFFPLGQQPIHWPPACPRANPISPAPPSTFLPICRPTQPRTPQPTTNTRPTSQRP